ncbi:extracellular matrix/biofilm regulator RemA [Wukongibacter sp. M2B1]|uniref:extracellular matrix/biofilm regulator RemA n=1 Tax=Wukongibacter sp. M2B1 TaxID=3088895 RepID=UPI003D7A3D9F
MDLKLVNIGFGNMISAGRIIAIVKPESAPIKRMINEAREQDKLVDATYGRRTRAVIICDSDHLILSAVQPETMANRFNSKEINDKVSDNNS